MNPSDFDEFHEVLGRLLAAMVLGAIIGIDRDLHHKPAGLRVLAMVSVGAALATMVTLTATARQQVVTYDGLSRVIQGVLQGIGFLGAGVIMHAQGKDEVHGLTTASAIWLTSVIGVTCGTGQWHLALATMVVAILILSLGNRLEKLIIRMTPLPQTPNPAEIPPRTP
ncbi:MAG: MgtC/SapB family protein [Planctomycetes bacterium]|nr:MgtC/SapB family protein [Planctomycetota bacterium]